MPSSTLSRGSFESGPRLAALVGGVLAGPITWATLLEVNYVLSYVACEQKTKWMLHLATAVAVLIVLGAGTLAWLARPDLGDESTPSVDPAATSLLVARFMAISALALCAWFTVVILATEIPVLVLGACQ
jgi:hypothetical protein